MPSYKLHYFNARGRAEITRLCFAAAGVKYEDIRYTREEWLKKKEEGLSPMGYLPMLEVDGKKVCESMAIARYVAREHGLCPSDSFEIAQCDQICDAFGDLLGKLVKFHYEKDEERKKTFKEEFDSTHLPAFLTKMTALLKSNNEGKGFFVGNKFSYADIVILHCCGMAPIQSAVEKFPEIKAHYGRIGEIPGIKEWIKNRPDTPMRYITVDRLPRIGLLANNSLCKMPNYKLYYFNARGRAEAIRLLFAAAGVQFEDVRFAGEEWAKKKQEGLSPMGYLPMLEVDGKKLCESMAIARYVARENGLCPSDSFEIALCDQITDACGDCFGKVVKIYFEKDEERKKAAKEEFDNTQLPAFLTKMTALLKSNNDGKGFFVGNKLTYADITFFDTFQKFEAAATEKYPELKALCQRIGDIPGIKEWIKSRPDTPM
ncbi:uncharacterized protein LOC116290139 [Actinia tenebrosa]|uniref:Uncharacterized protein LOC116290139 n=1 Tax=Actinia tenebrosa TaxID=6105 RepID=A0A6P8H980_ACTTE|nr:uncharacterized protein LOC116290139 [Actinia tenebrosa]